MGSKIIKTNKQMVSYSLGDIALNNYLKLTKNKAPAKISRPVVASIHLKNKCCCSGILSTEAPLTLFKFKLINKLKNSLKAFIYSIYRVVRRF
jgi:predicted alpha/beta-fold hydrolase